MTDTDEDRNVGQEPPPRDRVADERALRAARGEHYHQAPPREPGVSEHGPWWHAFTTDGVTWRWQAHATDRHCVELRIIDRNGHVVPIALSEDDLLDVRVQATQAIRRLRRANYRE